MKTRVRDFVPLLGFGAIVLVSILYHSTDVHRVNSGWFIRSEVSAVSDDKNKEVETFTKADLLFPVFVLGM